MMIDHCASAAVLVLAIGSCGSGTSDDGSAASDDGGALIVRAENGRADSDDEENGDDGAR